MTSAANETAPQGDDALLADLVARAEPIVAATTLELIEVELKGSRGRRLVKVIVDSDDGVDVDVCAAISRDLAAAIDENDPFDDAYTLEVSSPGATRPLKLPRDFRRNIGRELQVQCEGVAPVEGELTHVTDDALTIVIDGDAVEIAIGDIEHAKVLLPW